jgi:flagellar hook-length control protein FliK
MGAQTAAAAATVDALKPGGPAIVADDAKAAADSAEGPAKDSDENAAAGPPALIVSMPVTAPPTVGVTPAPDKAADADGAKVSVVEAVPSGTATDSAAAAPADAGGDADATKTLAASAPTGALSSDGVKAELATNKKAPPITMTAAKADASASAQKTGGTDDGDSDADDAGGKSATGAAAAKVSSAPDATRPPVAVAAPSDTRHLDSGKADDAVTAPRGDNAAVAAITSTTTVQGSASTTQAAPTQGNPTASAVPVMGLAAEIASRAFEGKRRFEIRLDPPELGRVDVRLDVSRDGHVTSRLIVERSETLDLLRRDAPNLERALESAGLRTNDSGLQFSLRDQSGNGYRPRFDEPMRPNVLIVPNDDVAVHDAVRRGYGVLRGLNSGIDIRV